MSSKANIVIDQGATFSADLYLMDDHGTPLVLGGYTANSQMRKWYTSTNPAATFTTFVNATSSTITLSLTANQTSSIPPGRYVYDVEIRNSQTTSRIVEGIVTVTPEVTR
jgi:hypothetical protein